MATEFVCKQFGDIEISKQAINKIIDCDSRFDMYLLALFMVQIISPIKYNCYSVASQVNISGTSIVHQAKEDCPLDRERV